MIPRGNRMVLPGVRRTEKRQHPNTGNWNESKIYRDVVVVVVMLYSE